jgi:hypothetical protein
MIGADEGVLSDLFGVLRIPGEAEGEAVEAVLVGQHYLLEAALQIGH